jgi:hypothetical protein
MRRFRVYSESMRCDYLPSYEAMPFVTMCLHAREVVKTEGETQRAKFSARKRVQWVNELIHLRTNGQCVALSSVFGP